MSWVVQKTPGRFGFLRILVAFCPGFGTAAVYAAVELIGRFFPIAALGDLDGSYAGLIFAMAVCFVLALVFGWFDAILYAPLPKVEGKPVLARLALSATLFVVGQIFLAPLIYIVTLILLDLAGIRF